MSEPALNPELEQKLRQALDAPAPEAAFANRLRAELIARAAETKPETSPVRKPARAFWRFAFVLLLIALLGYFFGPKIVTAMKQLFGYVPGAGLVDQSQGLRVLSEPVTLTRDGVTLSVESAVLSADKTVITYTLKDVPWESLSHQVNIPGCHGMASLRLPDGTELTPGDGGGTMSKFSFTYPSIASNINSAVFLLPCIMETLPGKAPENWELPLRFVPAPPDFQVAPVIEIQPSSTAGEAAPNVKSRLILERVVETENSYILIGKFIKPTIPGGGVVTGFSQWPDAAGPNGNELVTVVPSDISTASTDESTFSWAYEISGKPKEKLTLTFDAINVDYPALSASFQVDTGPNPADNQAWDLNRPIQIGDHTITITSVKRLWNGYLIRYENKTGISQVGFGLDGSSAGSNTTFFEYGKGKFGSQVIFSGPVPSGLLTVNVLSAHASLRGPWVLEWQPGSTQITQQAPENPMIIQKVVDLPDGYIFAGTFHAVDLPHGADSMWPSGIYKVTDASGREIYASESQEQLLPLPTDPAIFNWAVQIKGKDFAFPLTISLMGAEAHSSTAAASFEFDAGQNPQVDQELKPGIRLDFGGYPLTVDSIRFTGKGYDFDFTTDPLVTGIGVSIDGFTAAGGDGGGDGQGHINAGLEYENQVPKGRLKVQLNSMAFHVPGPWQAQWQPDNAQPGSPSPYGISLRLDKYIPLDDGYYLIGHNDWADNRIGSVALGGWNLKAYDSKGNEIPLEPASASNAGIDVAAPNQWVYKLYGKAVSGPVTLRAGEVTLGFASAPSVEIDIKQYGFTGGDDQLGYAYKVGMLPLDLPGLTVKVQSLAYQRQGDMKGFAIYLEADPSIASLPLDMEPIPAGGHRGGGGSGRNAEGRLVAQIYADGVITGQFRLVTRTVNITGKWETTWTPPMVDPDAKPELLKPVCLDLPGWKNIEQNPPALPALPGRLAVYGRILEDNQLPSLENYGILLTDLPGTKKQVFGKGVHPSASMDGTLLAYDWQDGIHVVDTASGKDTLLPGLNPDDYGPKLSPDGRRLAFTRPADMNLYLVNTDGSGLQKIADNGGTQKELHGWTPDGNSIYYLQTDSGKQSLVAKNISGGQETTLFEFPSGAGLFALSPDGKSLAYIAPIRGRMAGGLFLAPLEGNTAPKLLAQLDNWIVGVSTWSPSGKYLLINIGNPDDYTIQPASALLNINDCSVVPLNTFEGTAEAWVK